MKTLKQQFKTLKQVKPDQAQKEEFAKLLAVISADYRNPRGFSFRRAPALALLLILFLVGSGAGISLASQRALPGDALYPAKLAIEKVQIITAKNIDKKTELRLEFATQRLDEIEKVVAREEVVSEEKVEKALDDYKKTLDEIEKSSRAPSPAIHRSAGEYERNITELISLVEERESDVKIKEHLEKAREHTKEKLKSKGEHDSKSDEKEKKNKEDKEEGKEEEREEDDEEEKSEKRKRERPNP